METLTSADQTKGYISNRLPHWLPDSRNVLFTIMSEYFDPEPRTALVDVKTHEWRILLEDAADARYVPTGHLIFLRQGTLMAVPFDLQRLASTGRPVPVVDKVLQAIIHNTECNTVAGQFSVSDSGWLIYAQGGPIPDMQNSLVLVDQKGNAQSIAPFKTSFFAPRFSPDGQRIAYQTIAGKEELIWIYDIKRETANRLTSEGKAAFVNWTPDGTRVVFGWRKSGSSANLYWQLADGSQAMERLTTSDNSQAVGSCSPDGVSLAFVESRPDTNGDDILLLDLRSRRVRPFLNSPAYEGYPEFSPDGGWLAYASTESGREEVYVQPFPGPGGKWQISNEGGYEPLWSRNRKQLFYRRENQVWVVDVRTEGRFSPGKPRLLFEDAGMAGTGPIRGWDISLDGQKFLMVKLEERKSQPVTEMILVQNWFEELKRLCPTGRK